MVDDSASLGYCNDGFQEEKDTIVCGDDINTEDMATKAPLLTEKHVNSLIETFSAMN